eukprot:TRINITY_DN4709_c0_g1_i10.p2 TRINITY_DN4709_c0_g1~~TRINITY_DN4709_c0_g1_i10.p2  ORF type:complete len:262 (-),score=35.25 TRINITY_DN4709_c0_g1_i10:1223-2008(-)
MAPITGIYSVLGATGKPVPQRHEEGKADGGLSPAASFTPFKNTQQEFHQQQQQQQLQLPVPRSVRGYLRFLVLVDPTDPSHRHTVGVAHALDTKGGRKYAKDAVRNFFSSKKSHLEGALCPDHVTQLALQRLPLLQGPQNRGTGCPLGSECHKAEGWATRRDWSGGALPSSALVVRPEHRFGPLVDSEPFPNQESNHIVSPTSSPYTAARGPTPPPPFPRRPETTQSPLGQLHRVSSCSLRYCHSPYTCTGPVWLEATERS